MHAKVLTRVIVDETTGLMTIEVSGANDEIRHIEREKTLAIETARITLRQHKGLGDVPLGIDVTEVGPCKETVVATGTHYEPT